MNTSSSLSLEKKIDGFKISGQTRHGIVSDGNLK